VVSWLVGDTVPLGGDHHNSRSSTRWVDSHVNWLIELFNVDVVSWHKLAYITIDCHQKIQRRCFFLDCNLQWSGAKVINCSHWTDETGKFKTSFDVSLQSSAMAVCNWHLWHSHLNLEAHGLQFWSYITTIMHLKMQNTLLYCFEFCIS